MPWKDAPFDCVYGRASGTPILASEDEAAAFLAQAIFSRKSTYMWGGPVVPGDPIYEALMLSDKIMQNPGYRVNGPPYNVPANDLITLRRSIQTAYNFVNGTAGIQHLYYGIP